MLPESTLVAKINETRRALGLLEIEAVLALSERGNIVLDPFSTLISRDAQIGSGNVFYPCVSILCSTSGQLVIGDGNTFHTGTWIAAETGPIRTGSRNEFGEGGGFTAKANRTGARIIIGNEGRYQGGASVYGETDLGSGSQLLGRIAVDSCILAAGGSFRDPDPDKRGALMKGQGAARDLRLGMGQVISASGTFRIEDAKPQSFFHPKAVHQ